MTAELTDDNSGFTLIELLVVIALIGILSTLLLVNFQAARQRARDAQRKSDFRNIQTALRLYYNDRGRYPDSDASQNIVGCGSGTPTSCTWGGSWSFGGQTYMSVMPQDPQSPDVNYHYIYNSTQDSYTLQGCLENRSDDRCSGENAWCTAERGCLYIVVP